MLRTAAIGVLALMIAVFAGSVAATAAGGAPAAAPTCTASPVTDPMAISLSKSTDLIAWETVRASFTGSISNGHCAGDQFTITVPPELQVQNGASYNLLSPDGQVVAVMTVVGSKLVVTLTDYVQTHEDVQLTGWVDVRLTNAIAPGTSTQLNWVESGTTVKTPITTAACPNCTAMPTKAQKWGSTVGPNAMRVTIQSPTAVTDAQVFTFTDTLTSPGQAFSCPVTVTSQQFTARNQWGEPTDLVPGPAVTITACAADSIEGTFTIAKVGQAVRLYVPVTITDSTATSWTDSASLVSSSSTDSTSTQVVLYGGGGSGSGTAPSPTSTTTTSTTTAPTSSGPSSTTAPTSTSTSPTSGVLPTATTSTGPSSTTATTTSPSTTAGVVVTATASPSSPVAAPSRTLAFTGSSTATIVVIGAGLLALGCVLLLVTGRRRSVPD